MRHPRIIFTLLAALSLAVLPAGAQKQTRSNDYKLQKAIEILNDEGDEDKALKLLDEQLEETPDNVEALLTRVRILRDRSDYASALTDINHAIKVNREKKTHMSQASLFWWRATLYTDMEESEKAIGDFDKALSLARKGKESELVQLVAFAYGRRLYSYGMLDESDAVFRQMLIDDENDQEAMVGLARNMLAREQYSEAVELLDKAGKLNPEYSEVYHYRMKAYDKLGESGKAVDDSIEYIIRADNPDFATLLEIMSRRYNYAVAKLKARIKKADSESYMSFNMSFTLAVLYALNRDYALALKEYLGLENEYGPGRSLHEFIAGCYDGMGMKDKAIERTTMAIGDEPYFEGLCTRADYYRESGRYAEAIEDFTAAIEEAPDNCYGYYGRGWCYELSGDLDKAMEDYNLGIDIDGEYAYIRMQRGELFLLKGEKDKADEDFGKVLQIDTVASDVSCRMYALYFLGRDDEAVEWMQKIIDANPEDCGVFYDKACLYSRMGRLDEAEAAFEKCLEMGYSSYGHIAHDDDLDPIRERDDFKAALAAAKERTAAMVREYEAAEAAEAAAEVADSAGDGEQVHEIALKRKPGGTYELPCEINGLPLQMIFDTGASDVTISSVEANFMLKNDYLSARDVKGKKYYQIANGSLAEGTVITLREVKIGDAVLRNVEASVVKSQSAPLLFGQSALEKFGSITIDNRNNKLIIRR